MEDVGSTTRKEETPCKHTGNYKGPSFLDYLPDNGTLQLLMNHVHHAPSVYFLTPRVRVTECGH